MDDSLANEQIDRSIVLAEDRLVSGRREWKLFSLCAKLLEYPRKMREWQEVRTQHVVVVVVDFVVCCGGAKLEA